MCSPFRYAPYQFHMFMILGMLNEQLSVGFIVWYGGHHDTDIAAFMFDDVILTPLDGLRMSE